jgi:hypothetical protein
MDRALGGFTDDGLFVILASSADGSRSVFSWRPDRGWVARPAPDAGAPPVSGLWAVTAGAGSLYLLEGRDATLTLRQFDGTDWRPALDLSALAPGGASAAALVAPSAWSKTGSLVLAAAGRVTVYDLP